MTPCIEFEGYLGDDRYGRRKYKGKVVLAHRLAYAEANGLNVLTMGGTVLHSCDNPPCINQEHLSMSTQVANMADMVAKGRASHKNGEINGRAVLTAEQVQYIRLVCVQHSKELGRAALGRKFGVSAATISSIMLGKLWKELPWPT